MSTAGHEKAKIISFIENFSKQISLYSNFIAARLLRLRNQNIFKKTKDMEEFTKAVYAKHQKYNLFPELLKCQFC